MSRKLAKLPQDTWRVFHDLQRGPTERNIDHIVIGPAGVFALNTKVRNGFVKITSSRIYVNGAPTKMLAAVRFEAKEVAARLGSVTGTKIEVTPVLALLCDDAKLESEPSDVLVRRAGDFPRCLLEQPLRLTMEQIAPIYRAVVVDSTWSREDPRIVQQAPPPTVSGAEVTVTPWNRYGKKRLYISADGVDAGYFDLVSMTAHPLDESLRGLVEEAGKGYAQPPSSGGR